MNTKPIEEWIRRNSPRGAMKLAHYAGIHLNTLNGIRAHKHTPSLEVARKLASVLDMSLDELCVTEGEGPEAA